MPQLDVLRAFAAFAVVYAHATTYPGHNWGVYGVTLFFVLSGFLITGILLGCRQMRDRQGTSLIWLLRQFYARRSLRILPLYYFALLILVVVGYGPARRDLWVLATYLGDFYLPHRPPSAVWHFWSLAVEEQFYLLWPWAVLLMPVRALPKLASGLILFGPLYRLWGWYHGIHPGALWMSPFTSAEALAVGGLLAMVGPRRDFLRFLLIAGLITFAGRMVSRIMLPTGPQPLWTLPYSLLAGWLVGSAARGVTGHAGKILSFGPLLWLGTISYGIYVYHLPLVTLWRWIVPRTPDWLTLVAATAMTVVVAALSWYLFERPVSRLKRYFPYSAHARGYAPIANH